ncbi:MAG TPA: FtsX-like permease family protein [Chloroflexota bacterium]|nr:FtsX-like permease family protein [Chloroflexota bacterium]
MTTLFGISMQTIMQVAVGALIAVTVMLALFALRNRLLLKLGWRNIPRRPGQTVLIVVGLMLATVILTSAFTAGDTMSFTVRSYGAQAYGFVDETVTGTPPLNKRLREAIMSTPPFISSAEAARVGRALHGNRAVDGVMPVIALPAPVRDLTTRQSKAAADVLAVPARYPSAFGPLTTMNGHTVTPADLTPGEVYINHQAAYGLGARAGDRLVFYVDGSRPVAVRVAGILRDEGLASGGLAAQQFTDPEIVMPLGRLQALDGRPGAITHVLISNQGDVLGGASRTAAVTTALRTAGVLQPVPGAPGGYHLEPVKQKALTEANRLGTAFTSGFVAFGLFSMAAGILLIFLLFVMLAAERRVEMGIERAIGTKRRHLIQQFLFEGYAYDLVAAGVGVVIGVAVGLGLVGGLANLFSSGSDGMVQIQGHVEPRSIVVAFSLGALATFLAVAGSCWWVSKLNIVAALRDLPDETQIDTSVRAAYRRPISDLALAWRRLRRRRLRTGLAALAAAPWHLLTANRTLIIRGPLLIAGGLALFEIGNRGKQAFLFDFGLSLTLIGLAMALRWLLVAIHVRESLRNRIGFSLAGISLVVFWSLPFDFFRSDLYYGPEMFFLYGIMMIMGGVWTVMYNVDLLVAVALRLMSVASRIAPALRMAVTYPLLHRLRTGLTLFMFSLVVFALVVEIAFNGSFTSGTLNLNRDAGGFAVFGRVSVSSGIPHLQRQIDANPILRRDGITGGGTAQMMVDLRQHGNDRNRWNATIVNIADDSYLAHTRFTLKARAAGFASDAQVWQALRTHPGDAVASPALAGSSAGGSFSLHGLQYGSGSFTPVHVQMRDPRTGIVMNLTIVGLLDYGSTNLGETGGTYVGAATLAAAGDRPLTPTTYFFHVPPGRNVHKTALAIGSAFVPYGLDVSETGVVFTQNQSLSQGFYSLLAAFMALGLIVGVAALGVIATRSVVERRQHIGVLRAIGFRRRMVQLSFLLEASFVALAGIGLGVALGLLFSYQLISYIAKTEPGLTFSVIWGQIGLIALGAYLAAMLMTSLPAWQASRIYPAEALRYE